MPGAEARNMAIQFFHFCMRACLSLHSGNKISLQSLDVFGCPALCSHCVISYTIISPSL